MEGWRPPFETGPRPDPEPPKAPSEPESYSEARPMPCPRCESTRGYSRVTTQRVQCNTCKAILKPEEVDMQPSDKE